MDTEEQKRKVLVKMDLEISGNITNQEAYSWIVENLRLMAKYPIDGLKINMTEIIFSIEREKANSGEELLKELDDDTYIK